MGMIGKTGKTYHEKSSPVETKEEVDIAIDSIETILGYNSVII